MVVERQAQASLAHICRWSSTQTVRDENSANHHDLAAFITRLDFGPAGKNVFLSFSHLKHCHGLCNIARYWLPVGSSQKIP